MIRISKLADYAVVMLTSMAQERGVVLSAAALSERTRISEPTVAKILKILGQDIWGKPLLILGLMLVIAGIQLVTIGIVIEIQMRTYFESQQKRPYKIRKVVKGGVEEEVKAS